ncbi:hypothetical protein OKA04_24005 [Luteolibacter flavescens]|uniref:Uncharacterized protein n=1 Tax=Luteolibacter flavescens TaxID=1859460 RepID=A0ABT3FX65_9BACT|nr:hypothetical protein [Luteolibacter flavescens]MCW1887824.1 hypothetical protein [Luteolibacter flavescens]
MESEPGIHPGLLPVEPPPPAPEGPKVRREPRQLPGREHAEPIEPRHTTSDDLLKPRDGELPLNNSRGSAGSRMIHSLLPAAFIAAAGVTIYSLIYFLYPKALNRDRENPAPKQVVSSPEKPRPMPVAPPLEPFDPQESEVRQTPTQAVEQLIEETSPAVAANNVLDKFLKAKDAASRVGMVEPEIGLKELDRTLLSGHLPEVAQVFSDLPRRNSIEGFTDYPYRVSFYVQDRPNTDFAVLVRQRGDQPPKVFLPAFLDLVGGRLAAFTRQPNKDDPTRFHVILEPVVGCHEKGIPNADRKFTLKLLSSNFGRETARAYCSNQSRLREMVDKPDYAIRWGIRVPATVTIQWNHKEDPAKPYLELIDINSPDWNP